MGTVDPRNTICILSITRTHNKYPGENNESYTKAVGTKVQCSTRMDCFCQFPISYGYTFCTCTHTGQKRRDRNLGKQLINSDITIKHSVVNK